MRTADIEVTNRCNAYCNFCPRDRMPALGAMTAVTFQRVLDRLVEHTEPVIISFCGFGEPLLNPELGSFMRVAHDAGVPSGITTNASLLDAEKTAELLDAGMVRIFFSISDLGDDYEEVYNLDYGRTARNIDHFLEENARRGSPCELWVSIVRHGINRDKVEAYREYWRAKGVNRFFMTPEQNRGGALDRGYLFQGTDAYTAEAHGLMAKAELPILCPLPFQTIFIDWAGRYLLCCMDWEKRLPLGHVTEYSVAEMDRIKHEQLVAGNPVCRDCSMNPVNVLRERMLEAERDPGRADPAALDRTLEELKAGTRTVQHILDTISV